MLCHFSCILLFATLWTVARQAPLSTWFSRQWYWSGLPCPSRGDLPDPGIDAASLTSPALVGGFFTTNKAPERRQRWPTASQKQSLTKKWICQHLNLGLPNLQNPEKQMLLSKPPSQWYFIYGNQGQLRWLCLRNYLPRGIVILPFQCVGASWLLKNGDRNLGLPGATMSLPPVVSALHHLWDSLWSKLSPIAQDPNSSPLPRVRGEPAYCSDGWSEPRPGYGMTLPEPGPELTVPPDKRKPPLFPQTSVLWGLQVGGWARVAAWLRKCPLWAADHLAFH